jgi:hypothetical protein
MPIGQVAAVSQRRVAEGRFGMTSVYPDNPEQSVKV